MSARITPGLIGAPERVALEPDELVILVPAGVGHIRDVDPRQVRNGGERVTLIFEGRTWRAEVVEAREAKPGARVLFRSRVGWHEGQVGQ